MKNVKHLNDLSILHTNIRSINKNFLSLASYLQTLEHSFDVIGLSETWLSEIAADSFKVQGYNSESIFRSNKTGGGVSFLIKDTIQYNVRHDLVRNNEVLESLFIELPNCYYNTNTQSSVIIAVLYRPPNSNMQNFIDQFTVILSTIKDEGKICYIVGDTNINLLNVSTHALTSSFYETLYSFGFLPLITKPTRITENSSTLIDNIFCNLLPSKYKGYSGLLCTDITDHFPIFFINENKELKRNNQFSFVRDISEANIRRFSEIFSNFDWYEILQFNDTQEAYTKFHNIMKENYVSQ